MDCLRNFVLYCLRNEWITKNPFYYYLKEESAPTAICSRSGFFFPAVYGYLTVSVIG